MTTVGDVDVLPLRLGEGCSGALRGSEAIDRRGGGERRRYLIRALSTQGLAPDPNTAMLNQH